METAKITVYPDTWRELLEAYINMRVEELVSARIAAEKIDEKIEAEVARRLRLRHVIRIRPISPYLTDVQISNLTGLSPEEITFLETKRQFPPAFTLNGRKAWEATEVRAWLEKNSPVELRLANLISPTAGKPAALSISIEKLELSNRAMNVMRGLEIKTLGELVAYPLSYFNSIKGIGTHTVAELRDAARHHGLNFPTSQYVHK